MRSFCLLSVLFALDVAMRTAASPVRATKDIGGSTVSVIGPAEIPDIVLPNLPGGPASRKRALHGNQHLQPRDFHNADFSAAPNSSIPMPPPQPTAEAKVERRDRPSHKDHSKQASHRPGDENAPSGNDNPAHGAADAFREVGAVPKSVSGVFNGLPLGELPATPVTQPDNSDAPPAPPAPPPPPTPVSEDAGTADPNAYPSAPGYPSAGASDFVASQPDGSAPASSQKRHDLVLDTNPVLPPPDDAPRDRRMGVINFDSNRTPDPVDEGHKLSQGKTASTSADGHLDPQHPDVAQGPSFSQGSDARAPAATPPSTA